MKTLNIAVCDDEDFFLKDVIKNIEVYANEYEAEVNIEKYQSALILLEQIKLDYKRFDILFLDVEMPGLDGMEAAKAVRQISEDIIICFITSHEDYTLDAYKVEALGYLIKPVKYLSIKKILDKAFALAYYKIDKQKADEKYLQIQTSGKAMLLDTEKILYIEKRKNQSIFHLTDGEIMCYQTLSSIYEILDKNKFVYTHQGYIVYFNKIKEVKKNVVCLGNNVEVPLSRKYYSSIRDRHMDKINMLRREIS